jgi:hypothetical protein
MSFLRWASMVPYGIQMMTHHQHPGYEPSDNVSDDPIEPKPIAPLGATWARVIIISLISAFLGAAGAREFTMALQNQAQDLAIRQQGEQIDRHTRIIEEKLVTKEEFRAFVEANEAALGRISARNTEIMQELLQHDAKGKR